jgi:hypothetical protein
MTRQSKQVQKATLTKQITALHKKCEKGPAQTKSLHGKLAANRSYTTKTRGTKDLANSRKRYEGTKSTVSGASTL